MRNLLAPLVAGLALTGCVTLDDWSEAPGSDRYGYDYPAPVDWWGRNAVSIDVFYGPLAGYGSWQYLPGYGRVFLPAGVGSGWQPYSRGRWGHDSRYGRRWISDEPFGWATYHYGRWGQDPRYGWYWVPDTRFGGSWVDWRSGGDYSSWSPLPPYGYRGRNPWISQNRPDARPDRPDRPGQGQVATPRPPFRVPENAHPRSKPDWRAGEGRQEAQTGQGRRDGQGWQRREQGTEQRGERPPRRDGWQNAERPGFNRQPQRAPQQPQQGVHPRSPAPPRDAAAVSAGPQPQRAERAQAPRAERQSAPRAERQSAPRAERQPSRSSGRSESGVAYNKD